MFNRYELELVYRLVIEQLTKDERSVKRLHVSDVMTKSLKERAIVAQRAIIEKLGEQYAKHLQQDEAKPKSK